MPNPHTNADLPGELRALGSPARYALLRLVAQRPCCINELADQMRMSAAAVSRHVDILQESGLVFCIPAPGWHGRRKVVHLARDTVHIRLRPDMQSDVQSLHIPVGSYTAWQAVPTCGLASTERFIGQIDDPRSFSLPERIHAGLLWFAAGYVEYEIRMPLPAVSRLTAIELVMEIGSETAGVNPDWPSTIVFHIAGVCVGAWTSPGDFGNRRGAYTPQFVPDTINQYGLLKVLRVDRQGTTVDGAPVSDVMLSDLPLEPDRIRLRISAPEAARHPGGLTLYGSGFGNYGRDPVLRLFTAPALQRP